MIDVIFQTILYASCLAIGITTSINNDTVIPIALVILLIGASAYIVNIRALARSNKEDVVGLWEKYNDIQKTLNKILVEVEKK